MTEGSSLVATAAAALNFLELAERHHDMSHPCSSESSLSLAVPRPEVIVVGRRSQEEIKVEIVL